MTSDLSDFERGFRRHLEEYKDPSLKKARRAARPAERTEGLVVKLAVREKRLAMDRLFTHETGSISRLQAEIEAKRAARDAGWPIVGYVVSIESRK